MCEHPVENLSRVVGAGIKPPEWLLYKNAFMKRDEC